MTSVEVDSKRPRLGSYDHGSTTSVRPPPARPVPPQLSSHQHSLHHRLQLQQPPPPQPHQPHYSPSSPHHPPPLTARHPPPTPPPPLTLQQSQHHPVQSEASRPSTQHQPSSSHPPDQRSRPYSSHASTLPMPNHGGDSSEPSQYHHGHPYHARQYSNEPLSARTPTTPAQPPGSASIITPTDPNARHAAQYYGDPYRGQGDMVHSPYEQQMHPPMSMQPPQQPDRTSSYPSMPHQASDASGDYWTYGQMITVQGDGQPRRKAVRASQACESCRQKKCKCDEEKPICGNCKQNGTQCHYRDVPPPKQERTMMQVMDQISGLSQQINSMGHRLDQPGSGYVRKDELRGELDATINTIKTALHQELRELRDDMRGVQAQVKRASEFPQSPASRSQFASPNPLNGFEHSGTLSRSGSRRHYESRDSRQPHSPAGSQVSAGGSRGTPQQQQGNARNLSVVAIDPVIKHFDPLAGQLSIPLQHSTAAHKLLTSWHAIMPFYEGIIDLDYASNYVMRGETQRGNLRIFGQGEGSDGISKSFPPAFMKQPSTSEKEVSSPSVAGSSGSDGNWGIGFDGPIHPAVDTEGGLTPDGSLCLDAATISRLYESFLQNIWILHPFLNKAHLRRHFERFLRRYGYEGAIHPTPGVTSPPVSAEQLETPGQFKAPKRKRSDGGNEDRFATSTNPQSRRPLERSMNNALMLLILALGRICEHKTPLPPPVTEADIYQPGNAATATYKSPSYANTPRSVATPYWPPEASTPDAVAPSPYSDSSSTRYSARPRNIDRTPGLAYFAYAVGILGEHHGSPDLVHVQSSLLAGLYYGQMARVIDSWRWINTACTDCQLLFQDEHSFAYMEQDRADAIRFAYWTGLQLESDILAELDLPHSGISRLEDRMELPNWTSANYQPGTPEGSVLQYYWAQIHIRKILNRAHSALYNSGKEPLKNPGWTVYTADDLALNLQEWRTTLPPSFCWDNSDEPARDINDARLRGKYYGARYIIHRPFLHHLLEEEYAPRPQQENRPHKTKEEIISMARECVDAAKSSTTAFDGVRGRPIVTNIFGTAHAQFGNILVLAACSASTRCQWFINNAELESLIDRTIQFIANLAPLAPTHQTNLRILKNTQRKLGQQYGEDTDMHIAAASSSFGSGAH